jgi:hydrogenase nickel incorporation protein HypA/HybF
LDVAEEEAQRHGESARVAAIHLRLGRMSGVAKDALVSAFQLARDGSRWPAAELVVEEIPVEVFCLDCATRRILTAPPILTCPVCGAVTPDIVRGRELEVVALEIDS